MGSSNQPEPSNKKTILISLSVNVRIAVVNFLASLITGSAAMLAEALQTLVDTSHEAFLLLGVHQAKAPPDERFPHGRGKAVYFWGWGHVIRPDPVEFPGANYMILVYVTAAAVRSQPVQLALLAWRVAATARHDVE